MNYEQTLEFLIQPAPAYHRIGKAAYKNDLDNTLALDNYFGQSASEISVQFMLPEQMAKDLFHI